MDIKRIDVLDDEQCARLYTLITASRAVGRPWDEPDGLLQSVLDWRHEDKAEPREIHAVFDGTTMLGAASSWLPMEDNTDKMWIELDVDPRHRRRGAGTALIDHLVRRAGEEGRTELVVDAAIPMEATDDHPYRRFATSVGFTVGSTDIARHLELPVADAVLTSLAEEARVRWEPEYRLETHVDGLPEGMRESFCYLDNQLGVEAPTGEIVYEASSLTPERYQEYLDLERAQDRHRLTTVAIHRASDEVVAYTDLILPSGCPTRVWQWGTLVRKDHYGHRLGTAVKVENLQRLQHDHPERAIVETSNDETNSHMVDINIRLGFHVIEHYVSFHRVLTVT